RLRDSRRRAADLPGGDAPPRRPRPGRRDRRPHRQPGPGPDRRTGARASMSAAAPNPFSARGAAAAIRPRVRDGSGAQVEAAKPPDGPRALRATGGWSWRPTRRAIVVAGIGLLVTAVPAVI